MGLRDDMDALEYHIRQGRGDAWLRGTLTDDEIKKANEDNDRMPLHKNVAGQWNGVRDRRNG